MLCSIADNLPVATRLEFYPNREAAGEEEQKKDIVKDIQFEHGYRLGFMDNNKVDIALHCLKVERRWFGPKRFLKSLLHVHIQIVVLFSNAPTQVYLHNHLSFILYFHMEKVEEGDIHDYRVVRFEVVPQSVKVEGKC